MKISYQEHYDFLINKYGEEEGKKIYKKFLRSSTLETYIIKYGEEEGRNRFNDKKKTGTSLQKMIEKYGEVEGKNRYDKWKELTNQSEKSFIKRYGNKIGKQKYNEFKLNCVVKEHIRKDKSSPYNNCVKNTQIQYYLNLCDGNYDKAKEMLSERQKTSTLQKMIEKYGEDDGKKKYIDINKKKSITLDNQIKLYGSEEGTRRWNNILNNKRYKLSKQYYINKYGEDNGELKWKELNNKKIQNINKQSKIGNEFCKKLFNKLNKEKYFFDKIYFSENEYMFFVHDDDFKIILPDFFIKDYNIIVEFYGDYWHRNPIIYHDNISEAIRNHDKKRINKLEELGNKIIIVWESDYLLNKEKTINNVFNTIKQLIKK